MADEKYPEHERLAAVEDASHSCGEFLEWLVGEKGFVLAKSHKHTEDCGSSDFGLRDCGVRGGILYEERYDLRRLLAEFFQIDLKKLEDEKGKMIGQLDARLEGRSKR